MADSKRFLLRLDPRLFEVLRRWADDDLRSINAQIEYLLTDQARRAGRLPHRRTTAEPADAAAADEDEPTDPNGPDMSAEADRLSQSSAASSQEWMSSR
jgi:hypothetical protein